MSKPWPWEGTVQEVFVEMLRRHDWEIVQVANTATKQRGVDVVATKQGQTLAAEVKGFPSTGYEDPSRVAERKVARPNSQAKAWFAKGLLAALEQRHARPDSPSLLVLPDAQRYRSLLDSTRRGVEAAGVHVVLIASDGSYECTTWKAA